jgi:CRP-like cAMP-binding protein
LPQNTTAESREPPSNHFWSDLTPAERGDLQAIGQSRSYPAATVVCHQGDHSDHVLIIRDGWVKVTMPTDEGKNVFIGVRGPDDLVGESALFTDRQRNATITSLSPLTALVVLAERFVAFLDGHPRASRMVTRDVLRRRTDADRRVQAHAYADGTLRLVLLLIELAEMSAEHQDRPPAGEIQIGAPLTQQELGSWVDTSRETAARAFKRLRELHLVRTSYRKTVIMDLPALRSFADERRRQLSGG